MPSRADHILDRLDTHFIEEVGAAVSTPTRETWLSIVAGLGPQAQFGWSWPISHCDPPICVPYCPEIIDEQTKDLTDEDLSQYLDIIEFVCDSHISHWLVEPDAEERQRRVEEELLEMFPATLDLWSRVQLAVLDAATN